MRMNDYANTCSFLKYGRGWYKRLERLDPMKPYECLAEMRNDDSIYKIDKQDFDNAKHLYKDMTPWMYARIFDIPIEVAKRLMLKYRVSINDLDNGHKNYMVHEMSSKYFPFDGCALIYYAINKYQLNIDELAAVIGLSTAVFKDVMYGRRLITKEQVIKLAPLIYATTDFWRMISSDIDAILSDKVGVLCPAYIAGCLTATDVALGEWGRTKKIAARPNLILARLANDIPRENAARFLKLLEWQYADLEMCLSNLTVEDAQRLAVFYGMVNPQELLVIDLVPLNYINCITEVKMHARRRKNK